MSKNQSESEQVMSTQSKFDMIHVGGTLPAIYKVGLPANITLADQTDADGMLGPEYARVTITVRYEGGDFISCPLQYAKWQDAVHVALLNIEEAEQRTGVYANTERIKITVRGEGADAPVHTGYEWEAAPVK